MAAKKPAPRPKAPRKSGASKPKTPAARARAKAPPARWTLEAAMAALGKAGTAQNRKVYARHGAAEPMFGVSFAEMAKIRKSIGADHDLARALWATGNHDARVLAMKVAEPARTTQDDLERWAADASGKFLGNYVAQLASETPHGAALARKWLDARDAPGAGPAWALVGQMAMTDTATPDDWFAERIAEIRSTIHTAPNRRRDEMNRALIAIGCRSAALRKSALAAAARIGTVEVDHGETSCKTPDAAEHIEKSWAHSTSKGFESPAAHERSREPLRIRC